MRTRVVELDEPVEDLVDEVARASHRTEDVPSLSRPEVAAVLLSAVAEEVRV